MSQEASQPVRNVLLVEDDPSDEMLAKRALTRAWPTLKIDVARDGEEAAKVLFGPDSVADYHLILLDIKLPRRTGIELLADIRQDPRYDLIPVVMLTSSAEPADIQRSYALRANSFVQKALDFHDHMNRIGKCVDYWLSVNVHSG